MLKARDTNGVWLMVLFYGIIQLPIRLRYLALDITCVVSMVSKDEILGMIFFDRHGCTLDVGKPAAKVHSRKMEYIDCYGKMVASTVQIVRDITIPP